LVVRDHFLSGELQERKREKAPVGKTQRHGGQQERRKTSPRQRVENYFTTTILRQGKRGPQNAKYDRSRHARKEKKKVERVPWKNRCLLERTGQNPIQRPASVRDIKWVRRMEVGERGKKTHLCGPLSTPAPSIRSHRKVPQRKTAGKVQTKGKTFRLLQIHSNHAAIQSLGVGKGEVVQIGGKSALLGMVSDPFCGGC